MGWWAVCVCVVVVVGGGRGGGHSGSVRGLVAQPLAGVGVGTVLVPAASWATHDGHVGRGSAGSACWVRGAS